MELSDEDRKRFGRRGGKAPKYVVKFRLADIEDATGRTRDSIHKDRQRGKLDTKDLLSLSQYVVKHALSLKQGS
jgi:hypothetical protein